jgi:hypothetical protein
VAAGNGGGKFEYGKLRLPEAIHGEKQDIAFLLTMPIICKVFHWILLGLTGRIWHDFRYSIAVENGSGNIQRTMERL